MVDETFGGSFKKMIEVLAREAGADATFAGKVLYDRMPSMDARTKLLVAPRAYKGFGVPFIEAMSSGLPMVATEMSISREIIGDGGLLVPNSTESVTHVIRKLRSHPGRMKVVSEEERKRLAVFDIRTVGEKEAVAYREVVANV